MKMSVTLPTRQKPKELNEVWESALALADDPDSLGLSVYIDEDDLISVKAMEDIKRRYNKNDVGWVIGPRRGIPRASEGATDAVDSDIYMFVADDVRFASKGWDTAVRDAFNEYPDGLILGSTNDNHHDHDGFSPHFSLAKKTRDILGYYFPKIFSQNYIDTWCNEVFTNIGRYVETDMILQHDHDNTDQAKLKRLSSGYNFSLWYNTNEQRRQDAIKLLNVIEPDVDHSDFKYRRIHFI